MRWARIAGILIVAGSALSLPAAAISGPVGPGDTGGRDLGSLVLNACLALLGSGAALLSIAGPTPLGGRNLRIGLGTLAIGLLSLLASSLIPIPTGSNELQSWPFIVSGAIGLLATVTGTLVTVVSLARTPGPARLVARLFSVGLALVVVFSLLGNGVIALGPLHVVVEFLAVLGGVVIVLAATSLGVLAITAGPSAGHTSA
jgi:hypothetical protein